jgi:uncharacterized UBP type Zn finger protein
MRPRRFLAILVGVELCRHRQHIKLLGLPEAVDGCEECIGAGELWRNLRICLECGHVGCGDTSPGQHAMVHAAATHHPIARSLEAEEEWSWCYIDHIGMLTPEVLGSTSVPPPPLGP